MALAALVLGAPVPSRAYADEPVVSAWDGSTVATGYAGGDGTESNPYQIATADQFAYFAQQIEVGTETNAHYILTSDLDMTAQNWEPIGSGSHPFDGVFDGDGHTVTYKITKIASEQVGDVPRTDFGLFHTISGSVSNLAVDGSVSFDETAGQTAGGGLVAFVIGDGALNHCISSVQIDNNGAKPLTVDGFGGLCGSMEGKTISNCSFVGTITDNVKRDFNGGALSYGGIVGEMRCGAISGCKVAGNIIIKPLNEKMGVTARVGGIVGCYKNGVANVSIKNCYFSGTLTAQSSWDSDKASNGDNVYVAGILGNGAALDFGDIGITISNCYSKGEATNSADDYGAWAIVADSDNRYINGTESDIKVVQLSNCFYKTGGNTGWNATRVDDDASAYEKLTETSPGTWMLDKDDNIHLSMEFKKLATPAATFSATGDSTGTLSDLSRNMQYKVGKGDWIAVSETGSVELTGLAAGAEIQIQAVGDGNSTLNSDVQTIEVAQAEKPSGLKAYACTNQSQNDGKIVGVDNGMEYKFSGYEWTDVTGESIENLAPGKYLVRMKANGATLASTSVEVTVGAYSASIPAPPTYSVQLPGEVEHGKLSVNPSRAEAGERVTITVSPDALYELDKLTVRGTSSGNTLGLVDNGDGTYTFTMPREAAKVEVSFRLIPVPAFSDVDRGAWYAGSVDFVYRMGLMLGYGNSELFGVGQPLTRGELAVILWRHTESPSDDFDTEKAVNETGIPDVADGQFYTEAANWAVKNGVINGYEMPDGSRRFAPNDPVTLEQMVAIIGNLTGGNDVADTDLSALDRYADKASISPWAARSMAWATRVGLVNGGITADGTREARSAEPVARERAAAVLSNAFKIGLMK